MITKKSDKESHPVADPPPIDLEATKEKVQKENSELSLLLSQKALVLKSESRPYGLKLLMSHVKNFWIEGVLNKSIYRQLFIELNKSVQSDAVEHPWSMTLETDRLTQDLPPEKPFMRYLEK